MFIEHPTRARGLEFAAAAALIAMAVVRLPAQSTAHMRPMFLMVAELCALGAFSFLLFKINSWLACFAILALSSSFYPTYNMNTMLARHALFLGLAWYAFIYTVMTTVKSDNSLIHTGVCIAAAINAAAIIAQAFGFDPYWIASGGRMAATNVAQTGLMFNQNEVGALMAMAIPSAVIGRRKWFLPLIVIGLVLSKSTIPVIAVTAGASAVFVIATRRKIIPREIALLGILFAVSAVWAYTKYDTGNYSSAMDRIRIFKIGYAAMDNSVFHGIGLGRFFQIAVVTPPEIAGGLPTVETGLMAHSDIWQAIVEMGPVAGLLILGYFSALIYRSRKDMISVFTIVTIGCLSATSFIMHVATTAILAITMMAIIEAKCSTSLRECDLCVPRNLISNVLPGT